jgi:hypothetical protein
MYTADSLENKQTSIFKELISQRNSDGISYCNALSQKRIIRYNLERQQLEHKKGKITGSIYEYITVADSSGSR